MTAPGPALRRATIYDVARVAGVSAATVSRAFSRPGKVSAATAERIREAAEFVGYQAAPGRKPLTGRVQRRGMISLIVSDITNPVFFELIRGAEEEAALNGYTLLLAHSRESGEVEREAVERSLDIVDGVILTSTRMSGTAIRAMARQTPTLAINRIISGVPNIFVDHVNGTRQVLDHLAELNHSDVLYLGGPEASWANGVRWQTLKEHGASHGMRASLLAASSPTMDGGAALADAVLASRATAVIGFNDMLALGAMKALQQRGVRIPQDRSFVGFDNSTGSDLVEPGLTSVASPQHTVGATAVRTLLAMLRDHGPTLGHSVRLPTRLVVRGSTGPTAR
ncbi:LacI family DNA-binding transcriptional regulator [Jonesia quinghaiensis]|uniref:LacI family DNA-binding transcriptional regulator n=1 Tax=Jonesia quinghaiensis TaxID=262806 RepID=UPI00048BF085|nr:LacI family DNA-binding transcriptional regulator [Jonesia quinghaiensis]